MPHVAEKAAEHVRETLHNVPRATSAFAEVLEDGINKRDYRLVQGCVLVISITYIVANSFTDYIYRKLDPRIRLT